MKIPNYDSELVADKTKHKSLLGSVLECLFVEVLVVEKKYSDAYH